MVLWSGHWYPVQSRLGDRPILSEYQCLAICSHHLVHSKPLTLLHWCPFIQWSSVRAKRQAKFWSSLPCMNRNNTTSEREVSVPVIQHCSYLYNFTVSQLSKLMIIIVTWGAIKKKTDTNKVDNQNFMTYVGQLPPSPSLAHKSRSQQVAEGHKNAKYQVNSQT